MRLFAFPEGNIGCTTKEVGPDGVARDICGNDLVAYLFLKNRENAAQTVTYWVFLEGGARVRREETLQPYERRSVGLHVDAVFARGGNFATEAYFPARGYAGLQMRSLARFFDPDAAQYIPPHFECIGADEVP